ncbi:NAD(P)/FAD-dependent oxidoreductase [Gilvimarinus xylanilyticus]|uniref:NAD(P)/FAD-dependent oxidoreductase n=1 Tax=Gilvimarinus xylanilyticus TaxID=2944139 RepID=A0A9X2I5L2_9GAMM|nr:NAD(P)/FAD-dependent oxidoreductase [Gilvimarinus xylanilyticus]MCP8899872.1 NAD(P)/FAD-dependent oxidoreductase [Gilvimarinus xylanilyticus]
MNHYDCVIIGAGAAGLMCAATAGQRGRKVALLDHANKVGKKILMSGGGRCNFTNYDISAENYLSGNPHFCKSALSRYTQWDFIALVEKYGLAYHEKTLGQLFCDNKARDLLNILLAECDKGGVDIRTHTEIFQVEQAPTGGFSLTTSAGRYECQSLVIATGGLSIPTMGATGFGYDIAKQFGHTVTRRDAALVPFTFKGPWLALTQSLAGVAVPAQVSCAGQSFAEALLFTHKGISGPAALQISNYWYPEDSITVDWLPGVDLPNQLKQWRQNAEKASLGTLLSTYLPKRFVVQWLEFHDEKELLQKPLADWRNRDIDALSDILQMWQMRPTGTEGYRTAEVTRGGIDTDDVSSKTFASQKTPGLYFIGEVLDVTGWLGGYNFQWAWASGYCCGNHV